MATVWIDLDNAPHVPFFLPILSELKQRGHSVEMTARDFGYTLDMMRQHEHPFDAVGVHPGANKVRKVIGLAQRVFQLRNWARGRTLDVAVSHGSRGLVAAARTLGVPSLTLYDYEFVQRGIFDRFSTRVMLPEALGAELPKMDDKARTYPGFKEEVYLGDFDPDPNFRSRMDLDDRTLLVLRPPATSAHYHNPESEAILDELFRRVAEDPTVLVLVTPRTRDQAESVEALGIPNVRVLHEPVRGLDLLHHADLVVSGGGTMNREAALMGIPVYSIFMGKVGVLDRSLTEAGRLNLVRSVADVGQIRMQKKPALKDDAARRKLRADAAIRAIVDEIEALAVCR